MFIFPAFIYKPRKLIAFNKTFFEVGIVENNYMYRWVYFLGLPDQAEYHYFQVTLQKDSGEKLKSPEIQVRSLVEDQEQSIANEAYSIAMKAIQRFVSENNGKVKYSIKLRSLKDEAKDEDEESGIDD